MKISELDTPSRVLLDTYKDAITARLYDEMLTEIKPKLRAAAEAAVADLRGELEQHYDHLKREAVLRITLEIDGHKEPTK